MKVMIAITEDELCPYFGFDDDPYSKYDPDDEYLFTVDQTTIDRWKEVLKDFRKYQRELSELKRSRNI